MKPSRAIIMVGLFILQTILLMPAYVRAGQDTIDINKETKETIGSKLDVCLKSNVININNYKNLQVLYTSLLNEKRVLEQKLKTLEDIQEEQGSTEQLERDKERAVSESQEYKKNAKNILYLIIGALIAFGLNKYFSNKAKYHLVAENYSLAKLFGIMSFIFLGIFSILIILFVYFLLVVAF